MKIAIFGTGYVGLVTGACMAEIGHTVMCVDTNADKIALLKSGGIPIFEPGLKEIVENGIKTDHLRFTTDAKEAIDFARVIFIAVGTPPDEDGSADISAVIKVSETIAAHMTSPKLVINKSTVPVGTGREVARIIRESRPTAEFDVASNPEFLREGAAIEDFMKPDRVVIGVESARAREVMAAVHERTQGCPMVAHNAGFERWIWELHCVPKLGWPAVHERQWRCSMAKARAKGRLKGKQPKLPLAARKTIHRRYHDPGDDASLADLAEEYSVGRSTIHRIISSPAPPRI